ncbi:MBL fold metallo-hydrolase [Singulisphaera rosea]
MTNLHHINGGTLQVPPYSTAYCHCLVLEDKNGLALVDTGIGLEDVRHPAERLGKPLIDMAGFRFNEPDTAIRRLEALGLRPGDVSHVVLTHADPDHTGGLADFPQAQVHISEEELASVARDHFRYVPTHFAHKPHWTTHAKSSREWFGLEARPVELGFEAEVLLIPLFGHTLGHCGIAIRQGDRWVLHAGDAYYLRVELTADDHPVSQLTAMRADDNARRLGSLEQIRRLVRDHGDTIDVFGYHDGSEFPERP